MRAVFLASAVIVTCASPTTPVAPPPDPAPVSEPVVADESPPTEPEPEPEPDPKPKPLVFVSELHMQFDPHDCELLPDRRVEWDKPSATLRPHSLEVLDDVAELMRRNPMLTLRIDVHSDSKGGDESNLERTETLAKVIADHLSAAGIDPQRFTARGYGEMNPISEASREELNRVEFYRSDYPSCAGF